eukprot:gene5147-3697_t
MKRWSYRPPEGIGVLTSTSPPPAIPRVSAEHAVQGPPQQATEASPSGVSPPQTYDALRQGVECSSEALVEQMPSVREATLRRCAVCCPTPLSVLATPDSSTAPADAVQKAFPFPALSRQAVYDPGDCPCPTLDAAFHAAVQKAYTRAALSRAVARDKADGGTVALAGKEVRVPEVVAGTRDWVLLAKSAVRSDVVSRRCVPTGPPQDANTRASPSTQPPHTAPRLLALTVAAERMRSLLGAYREGRAAREAAARDRFQECSQRAAHWDEQLRQALQGLYCRTFNLFFPFHFCFLLLCLQQVKAKLRLRLHIPHGMESVTYDPLAEPRRRLGLLRRALWTLMEDVPSRKDLRCLALLVTVDVSGPIAAMDAERRASATQRRRARADAYCSATNLVRKIMEQASADATALESWLHQEVLRGASSEVRVIVAAVLAPRTWRELELFRTWQQQPGAASSSPLRRAAVMVLRLESEELVLGCAAGGPWRPPPLGELLLPHQSLLLDLTWCIRPPSLPHRSAEEDAAGARHGRRGMGRAELVCRSFFDVFQRSLVPPKGRLGLLVRYAELLRLGRTTDGEPFTVAGLLSAQRQLTDAHAALHSRSGGLSKNTALPWLTSYGGPAETVAGDSLAPVRRLRDAHGLLNLLLSQYAADTFTEAAGWWSRVVQRWGRGGLTMPRPAETTPGAQGLRALRAAAAALARTPAVRRGWQSFVTAEPRGGRKRHRDNDSRSAITGGREQEEVAGRMAVLEEPVWELDNFFQTDVYFLLSTGTNKSRRLTMNSVNGDSYGSQYPGSAEQYEAEKKPQAYDYGQPMPGKNTEEYPEAAFYMQEPADGEPLYGDKPGAPVNPHLRRFVKKGWKDVWAGVLFLCFFILTFACGVYNKLTYTPIKDTAAEEGQPTISLVPAVVLPFISSCCLGFFMIPLMKWMPKEFIMVCNISSIFFIGLTAILSFIYVDAIVGIIMAFATVINAVWFVYAIRRIPFAAAVLRSSINVLSSYKAIFLVSFFLTGVLFLFTIFWSFALSPSIDRAQNNISTGFDTFVVLFFIFTFFWTMQVLPNLVMTTVAGVTATWYFVGFDNMPQNPTLKSFRRATTTSFGSICFGSLLVAVIQFMRFLVESARRNEDFNFLTCCLDCLLSFIEGLVEYFNMYAYVHIAMYGYDYITAAKHSFELFQQCLCAALFNDCLINPTLSIFATISSLTIGVLAGLTCNDGVTGVVAFMVSMIVQNIFFTTVKAATLTIFVCFAEVPEALRVTDPDLYDRFQEADQGFTNNNASSRV